MEEEHNIQRSLHYEIGNICRAHEQEELSTSTAKDASTVTISREAIAALTELTYQFSITSFANDLSSFSAHGNRSIINGRDVKLALRKAPRRIREQFDKLCAENKVNCATTTATTGKEQKKGNTITSAFSKAPADKDQGSSFNFNFEESSSDESENSEIFSNVRAHRRSRKFSSASSSSRLDDSSSVTDGDDDGTKRRRSVGRGEDIALMSLGTEESSSLELHLYDKDENEERILLQSIDDGGCIDLSSD
jgi:histone H3/H4